MGRTVRVFVVEDHPLSRLGIVTLVRSHRDLELAGETGLALEAVAVIAKADPDVALLDIDMREVGGIEIATKLRDRGVRARVVLLTALPVGDWAPGAVASENVVGFVPKSAERLLVVETILAAAQGGAGLPASVHRAAASHGPPDRGGRSDAGRRLSEREVEVLRQAARGLAVGAMACELGLSEPTVKTHLRNVYAKLGVPNRAAAVASAMREGLLE